MIRELQQDGDDYPITSAEVMVLRKLDWFRKGGESSERQWRDILALLRVQEERLDEPWMSAMAARCDLVELLTRAREEAR